MRKMLKKFSLVLFVLINLSILFTKKVFADMAMPTGSYPTSSKNIFILYIAIAIILAIIIGMVFIVIVKKNKKKKNSQENNEDYNNN